LDQKELERVIREILVIVTKNSNDLLNAVGLIELTKQTILINQRSHKRKRRK